MSKGDLPTDHCRAMARFMHAALQSRLCPSRMLHAACLPLPCPCFICPCPATICRTLAQMTSSGRGTARWPRCAHGRPPLFCACLPVWRVPEGFSTLWGTGTPPQLSMACCMGMGGGSISGWRPLQALRVANPSHGPAPPFYGVRMAPIEISILSLQPSPLAPPHCPPLPPRSRCARTVPIGRR